jgi:hypothetical protein
MVGLMSLLRRAASMANTQRRLVPSPTDLNYAFLMENIHTYSLEDEIARWPTPPRLRPQRGLNHHNPPFTSFLRSLDLCMLTWCRTRQPSPPTKSNKPRNLQQNNPPLLPPSRKQHTALHTAAIPSLPTEIYIRIHPHVPASGNRSRGDSQARCRGTGSS